MSQPPRLFSVMSEFTYPETLARVAKCSKAARVFILPILERKKNDVVEMREMIPRLLPSIAYFRTDQELSYYQTMLDAFFTLDPAQTPMLFTEISYAVGLSVMGNTLSVVGITDNVMPAMKTLLGRRLILQAIDDWRTVLLRRPQNMYRDLDLLHLTTFTDSVRADYAVVEGKITSVYERRYDV